MLVDVLLAALTAACLVGLSFGALMCLWMSGSG